MLKETERTDDIMTQARQDLSAKFSAILDDRWPLVGRLMAAVDQYVEVMVPAPTTFGQQMAAQSGLPVDIESRVNALCTPAQSALSLDTTLRCPKCGTVTQPRWHYNDWRLHPTCNERARKESLRLKEPINGEHLHFICECGHERVVAITREASA